MADVKKYMEVVGRLNKETIDLIDEYENDLKAIFRNTQNLDPIILDNLSRNLARKCAKEYPFDIDKIMSLDKDNSMLLNRLSEAQKIQWDSCQTTLIQKCTEVIDKFYKIGAVSVNGDPKLIQIYDRGEYKKDFVNINTRIKALKTN